MHAFMSVLGSIIAPLLLLTIGWRGLPKHQRGPALRVLAGIVGVIAVGTSVYLVVLFELRPGWIEADCEAGAAAVARGPQAGEPSLSHDAFMAGCRELSMSAAECASPEHAARFPHRCDRYVDEIHARLPTLVLPVTQRPPPD